MIIDFHTHVFSDKIAEKTIAALASLADATPHANGTVDGLLGAINKAQIDLAIALPVLTKPSQFESVNNFALELNKKGYPILSFAGIHPVCEDLNGKMKTLKEMGFKGVKIHPDYQETFFDDPAYIEILKAAKEFDLIVCTHAGVDDGYKGKPIRCTPDRVINALKQVDGVKLVLAHVGGSRLGQEVFDKLAGLNVYFDTSFYMHELKPSLFKKIVEKHGANKILFATDSPWRDIKEEIDILNNMGLTPNQLDLIYYKNAKKLLSI